MTVLYLKQALSMCVISMELTRGTTVAQWLSERNLRTNLNFPGLLPCPGKI